MIKKIDNTQHIGSMVELNRSVKIKIDGSYNQLELSIYSPLKNTAVATMYMNYEETMALRKQLDRVIDILWTQDKTDAASE